MLCWPALLNGYPLVFADTGTYLSQAIQHYVGWDRPAFYSLFLFAIHWKTTTWSIVVVQALLTLYALDLTRRAFLPRLPRTALLPVVGLLCLLTPLPWFVSQIMPDLFTGLLPVALATLVLAPVTVGRLELRLLALLTAWMIAFHLSHIWVAVGVLVLVLPLRRLLIGGSSVGYANLRRAMLPILLALLMVCTANAAAFRRFSISPFGSVFLFARLVYDGPAMKTLDADCSTMHWKVCRFRLDLPPHADLYPTSDHFLWLSGGPLVQLGGGKVFAPEAGAIVMRTLAEHPLAVAESALVNFGQQALRYHTGDGLHAWPREVGGVIARSFPRAEYQAFIHSRQNRDRLQAPGWLEAVNGLAFWIGLAATTACLVHGLVHRRPLALLCGAVLVCLVVNAAVAGMLSGPHDRYQNRIIWLTLLVPLMAAAERLTSRAHRPQALAALAKATRPSEAPPSLLAASFVESGSFSMAPGSLASGTPGGEGL